MEAHRRSVGVVGQHGVAAARVHYVTADGSSSPVAISKPRTWRHLHYFFREGIPPAFPESPPPSPAVLQRIRDPWAMLHYSSVNLQNAHAGTARDATGGGGAWSRPPSNTPPRSKLVAMARRPVRLAIPCAAYRAVAVSHFVPLQFFESQVITAAKLRFHHRPMHDESDVPDIAGKGHITNMMRSMGYGLNRVKIVYTGAPRIGRSSVAQRLSEDEFGTRAHAAL